MKVNAKFFCVIVIMCHEIHSSLRIGLERYWCHAGELLFESMSSHGREYVEDRAVEP